MNCTPDPTTERVDGTRPFSRAVRQRGAGEESEAGHDLNLQRLRILRCTAAAMANSPGGLRFKPGTRPWLEGLCGMRWAQVQVALQPVGAVPAAID